MSRKSPTRELLDTLGNIGVPKGKIAETLLIAPSAVTALFAGERQLKYDEAVQLMDAFFTTFPMSLELPVIGMAGAGNWVEAIADPQDTVVVPSQAGIDGRFVVEVKGQSMNQLLPDGSLAIVNPDDREIYVGRIYLLQNEYGEGTIKRFRVDPTRFEPVSDDPSFEPIMLGAVDFQVIGRVTGAIQKF